MMFDRARLSIFRSRKTRYRHVFGSREGKFVLRDLLRKVDDHEPVFTQNDDWNTHAAAYRDGRRSIVLEITRELNLSDDDLIRMSQKGAGDDDYREVEWETESAIAG